MHRGCHVPRVRKRPWLGSLSPCMPSPSLGAGPSQLGAIFFWLARLPRGFPDSPAPEVLAPRGWGTVRLRTRRWTGMLKPRTTIDRAPRLLRSRARRYIKPTWAQRKPMPKNRIMCCCRDPLRFRFRQQTRSTGRASVGVAGSTSSRSSIPVSRSAPCACASSSTESTAKSRSGGPSLSSTKSGGRFPAIGRARAGRQARRTASDR